MRLPCLVLDMAPTSLGRDPEDFLGAVLVRVFGVGAVDLLEPLAVLIEGVRDVLEEVQAEDDALVFGGAHAAA